MTIQAPHPADAEQTTGRWLLWDFDGTLARRQGGWTGTLLGLLRQHVPDLQVTADIAGATAAGIPAILVRKSDPAVRFCRQTLMKLPDMLSDNDAPFGKGGSR